MVRKFAGVKQGVVWTSEIGKKDNSRRNDYVQRDSLLLLSLSLSLPRATHGNIWQEADSYSILTKRVIDNRCFSFRLKFSIDSSFQSTIEEQQILSSFPSVRVFVFRGHRSLISRPLHFRVLSIRLFFNGDISRRLVEKREFFVAIRDTRVKSFRATAISEITGKYLETASGNWTRRDGETAKKKRGKHGAIL